MTITATERPVHPNPSPRRLDERLARSAVLWSIHSEASSEDAASELLALARGNRTAVERALGRVEGHGLRPEAPTAERAAAVLRLTLARGTWAW